MNLAPVCSDLQNLEGLAESHFGFLLKTAQEGPVNASHQQEFGNQPVRGPRMQTQAKIPCSSHYLMLSRTLGLSCPGSANAEFTEDSPSRMSPKELMTTRWEGGILEAGDSCRRRDGEGRWQVVPTSVMKTQEVLAQLSGCTGSAKLRVATKAENFSKSVNIPKKSTVVESTGSRAGVYPLAPPACPSMVLRRLRGLVCESRTRIVPTHPVGCCEESNNMYQALNTVKGQ